MDSARSSSNAFTNYPVPPPLADPPPTIFKNTFDGNALPPNLTGNYIDFGDFEYPLNEGAYNLDATDPKRRRIARACDMCRKKKIKCDGRQPCEHCEIYHTECAFTFTEKKRAQPKGAKYIEGLENRLARMKNLLKLSGLLGEGEETSDLGVLEQRLKGQRASSSPLSEHRRELGRATERSGSMGRTTPAGQGSTPSPRMSALASTRTSMAVGEEAEQEDNLPARDDMDDLSEMMDSLITNNEGETRYIGSASGVSIFSPKGIKWVTEKTGDTSFASVFATAAPKSWHTWKPEIFGDIFARHDYTELPPKDLCIQLINEFFDSFNNYLPLFHEATFVHLVDLQYTNTPYHGSGWWACLNTALAISYRQRVMRSMAGAGNADETAGWAYFKNALAVIPELLLKNTDLFTAQALIAMTVYLQGTPNPQPSFQLAGAAVRSAHAIGLHKRGHGYGFNETEIEQRKRVFWITHMIDKDICLRSGRPPAQDDNDFNVELPSESPEDGLGNIPLTDGTNFNVFRAMCTFSLVQSKVFQRLYSVKASKQTDGELLGAINDLDAELEQWKDSIPLEFRPEHDIISPDPAITINIAVIHFAYYNCVSTIHRRSVMQGMWSNRLAQYALEGRNLSPINHRVFQSAQLSVAAARLSIALLKYIPQGDYSLVWLIIYYPISALVSVFGHIVVNPSDPRARSDLELISMVVNFLQKVTAEETTDATRRMYEVCRTFEGTARNAIEKAERELNTRQKRKHEREQKKYGSVDLGYSNPTTTAGQQAPQSQAQAHAQSQAQVHPLSLQTQQQQQQQQQQRQQAEQSKTTSPASARSTTQALSDRSDFTFTPGAFVSPSSSGPDMTAQLQAQHNISLSVGNPQADPMQRQQQSQQPQYQQQLQHQIHFGTDQPPLPFSPNLSRTISNVGNGFAGLQHPMPQMTNFFQTSNVNTGILGGFNTGNSGGGGSVNTSTTQTQNSSPQTFKTESNMFTNTSPLLNNMNNRATTGGMNSANVQGMASANAAAAGFGNLNQFGNTGGIGDLDMDLGYGFVPQDLWSMPMTFEWDWGDANVGVGGGGGGGGINGA